ncbi:MAG: hypothetical protein ACOX7P_07495 [Oscillospiraceae bacterium]|jgi:hypothetical protein
MVRVIMGPKGTGKTKQMIEMVNDAARKEDGNVVCIERGPKLTYDIDYRARLIEAGQFDMTDLHFLKGFISGLYAGNYDISQVFIDSLFKIIPQCSMEETEDFLNWCENFGKANDISFTIMITADADEATPGIRKYFDRE